MNRSVAHSPTTFAWRALLFAAPFILTIVPMEWLLWRTGETIPVEQVLELQQQEPDRDKLWMRGVLDQGFYAYKWAGIQRTQPRILALGSSRAMKFREPMFAPDSGRFYNAGGLVQNLDDLTAFANQLPQPGPRVILLGIDIWWLNEARHTREGFSTGIRYDAAQEWTAHLQALKKIHRHWPHLRAAENASFTGNIGAKAIDSGEGFRADGSIAQSGVRKHQERFHDPEIPPIAVRVRQGRDRFEWTSGISRRRLDQLRSALQILRRKDVAVLLYAPPLDSASARLMETIPQQKTIWSQYRSELPRLCAELQIPFCGSWTPQALGLDDRAMFDGLHAEETLHLHILRTWLRNPAAEQLLPGTRQRIEDILCSPRTGVWRPDYNAGQRTRERTAQSIQRVRTGSGLLR